MKCDVLIFSKARAAQLDLLLQSIERFSAPLYKSITLLIAQDVSADHIRAYSYVPFFERFPGIVCSVAWDGGFEAAVRYWLQGCGPSVSFLVDDDVFWRKPLPYIDGVPLRELPFSPRAGDYDYPWSLDGCIYERHLVEHRIRGFRFDGPTPLEAGMAEYGLERFRSVYSCLIGIPANRVSDYSGMPTNGYEGEKPDDLLRRFLSGDRLSLDLTLAGVEPRNAHERIPLRWVSEAGSSRHISRLTGHSRHLESDRL